MPDLITRERALRNLDNRSLTAEEALLLDALIAAVSRAVERHCGRSFAAQQYDELYHGAKGPFLLLDNFPILSVERVAYGPTVVLKVINTSAANQRATVQVTSDGLRLVRVASGTTTISDLPFTSHATLAALVTAIDALGNGWDASVASADYSNWASADLRALQGAFNAKDVEAGLRIHVSELTEYDVEHTRGGLLLWGRAPSDFAAGAAGSHGSLNYWRVIYTAGFETIPEDVQEACAAWVAALFWQAKRDPNIVQEAVPAVVSRSVNQDMPSMANALLRPYRAIRV